MLPQHIVLLMMLLWLLLLLLVSLLLLLLFLTKADARCSRSAASPTVATD